MDIRTLQDQVHQNAKNKGFWDYTPESDEAYRANVATKLLLIVSEAVEAMDEIRAGKSPSTRYHSDGGKPEGFPSELADIVIRVLDLAGGLGVDLQDVIEEKMTYNASRDRLHGKKF